KSWQNSANQRPQTLYAKPANQMVATFIGNPPMNLLHATYDGTHFQVEGQPLPVAIACANEST
ncbi:MAG: hypothetical protein HC899_29640, partial [Leptolyngbyaceae cyanobacterium SM1_4_3]|nr:hypothetical protein [Leptolyngbyaceae cyanobacterium SM1_4_3]